MARAARRAARRARTDIVGTNAPDALVHPHLPRAAPACDAVHSAVRRWPSRRRLSPTSQETTMDRNRIEGKLKQVKGSVKEALGKVTGDRKTEAEGVAEQQAGKMQEQAGEAADAVRKQTGTDRH